jgi:TatA/E family protein of Tat protein translocase
MGLDNPLHIAFLVIILLLLFGARRLPEIGRSLGTGMREFKDSISGTSTPQQLSHPAQPVAQQPLQAQPVQAQPVQAPQPVAAQPAPVAAQPAPVAAQPAPVAAQPAPVAAQPLAAQPPAPAPVPAEQQANPFSG